ncbi:MAG: transglutaminase-like domain-containing protein [Kofleriaceae bacterium]
MRGGSIVLVAITACVEHVPAPRLPAVLYPSVESDGGRSYPTLEPAGRIGAVPIDPYGPDPVLRGVVGDHVPSDVDFGDPGAVTKMLVDVKSSAALPDHPHHHVVVEHDIQHVTIEVGPGSAVTRSERAAALRATSGIDAGEPSIKRAARDATQGVRTDRAKVDALVAWTYQHMTYVHADETVASTVLSRGSGDCSEFSLLFVALSRAAGVPARRVVGLAATEVDNAPAFGFHAWAEVALDGHWVQVDPTWNETVADATHVELIEGDGEAWSDGLAGLRLAVVELERDARLVDHADARMLTRELPSYLVLKHR